MASVASAGEAGAALAADAGALDALKRVARDDPKRALSAAAAQFEALFVGMLLKSMREALPQDGMLQSDSAKLYTSMFDQQIAQQMGARGIGLRQMLERQLAPALAAGDPAAQAGGSAQPGAGAQPGAAASGVHGGTTKALGAGQGAAAAQPAGRIDAHRNGAAPLLRGAAALTHVQTRRLAAAQASRTSIATGASASDTSEASSETSSEASRVPAVVQRFIDRMRPHAEAAARVVGVPAELLLAQAGLETGWGRSQPKTTDGSASHNLFGIKAGQGWTGPVASASTTEYVAGALVRTVARFRSYASYAEAFQDFGRMITGNARYAGAVQAAADPVAYAKGLQRGGYATDPQYADKLLRAIRLVTAAAAPPAPAQVAAGDAVNRSRADA